MRLIDADFLLEDVRKHSESYFADDFAKYWVDRQPTIVPSAQPERKKGKWINHRNDNGHNIADCSECGSAIQWFDDDEKPKFCCMCGADMRGEQDE